MERKRKYEVWQSTRGNWVVSEVGNESNKVGVFPEDKFEDAKAWCEKINKKQ